MFDTLFSDIRLYNRLIGMQLRAQLQYKINLVIDISTYFCITIFEFLALVLYFIPFPSLLGWHVGEVILLSSIMSLGFGFAEMLGAGIDNFSEMIRRGDFDRLLLRPVGSFIQLIGSDFRLRRLGRLTQGVLTFVIALNLLPQLHWTPGKIAILVIGIVSGACIFISVLLLGATVCFWTIETTELTNILTYGGREMLSYPITIYHQLLQRFFLFIVPLSFGSYIPTCYLLDRSLPFGIPLEVAYASPLIALSFAFVAGIVWQFGVRHYQSTGS